MPSSGLHRQIPPQKVTWDPGGASPRCPKIFLTSAIRRADVYVGFTLPFCGGLVCTTRSNQIVDLATRAPRGAPPPTNPPTPPPPPTTTPNPPPQHGPPPPPPPTPLAFNHPLPTLRKTAPAPLDLPPPPPPQTPPLLILFLGVNSTSDRWVYFPQYLHVSSRRRHSSRAEVTRVTAFLFPSPPSCSENLGGCKWKTVFGRFACLLFFPSLFIDRRPWDKCLIDPTD